MQYSFCIVLNLNLYFSKCIVKVPSRCVLLMQTRCKECHSKKNILIQINKKFYLRKTSPFNWIKFSDGAHML